MELKRNVKTDLYHSYIIKHKAISDVSYYISTHAFSQPKRLYMNVIGKELIDTR